MKLTQISAAVVALVLSGCAANVLEQGGEKADTDASLAYAAIATTVNAYEARAGVTPAQTASAEALKNEAWKALLAERQIYAAAGTVDLASLTALAAQASALGN